MDRKKAIKLFGIFLILMLLFTILSRSADSLTIARVQVRSPGKQVITHTVSGSGTVSSETEEAVFVLANQKIKKVYIEEGSRVQKGDILFEVDMDTLQEQIDSQERQVKQQQLTNGDAASSQSVQEEQQQRELARAREDYQTAQSQGDAAVARAQEEVDIAYQRLEEYYQSQQGFQAEDEPQTDDNSQRNALEDEIRAKEQALEDAIASRDTSLQEAARKIEDAQAAQASDSTEEIGQLDQEGKEVTLQKLQKLQAADGKIYAETEGTVTALNLHAGEVSSDGAALLLAGTGTGCQFVAPVNQEDEKYVEEGAAVTLTGPSELEDLEELTVAQVVSGENENGETVKNLVVNLPEGVGQIGQAADYAVTKNSKTYDICLPVSALQQDDNGYFVYVAEEASSVLGEEQVVRKHTVTVLEKNESYVALSEDSLNTSQKVIVYADREIQEGSRVRFMEE